MTSPALRLDLVAERSEVGRALDALRTFGTELALDEDFVFDLCLAVDEALANIILHGYRQDGKGKIRVRGRAEAGILRVVVEDHAPPFNPLEAPPPKLDVPPHERKPGGLGIFHIRTVTHEVDYIREGDCNRLTLIWRLEPNREPGRTPPCP
jgi:serine/threonine-protein kinase RsbW